MFNVAKALHRGGLSDRIDLHLAAEAVREAEERAKYLIEPQGFHPSQIGGCLRAVFYAWCGVPMESNYPKPKTLQIFRNGDGYHTRMQNIFRDMGLLWGQWRCQKCAKKWTGVADSCPKCSAKRHKQTYEEIDFQDAKEHIVGSCDGIIIKEPLKKKHGSYYETIELLLHDLKDDLACLEFKSMNSRQFTTLRSPVDKHEEQGNCYMLCLRVPKIHYVYENKDTQEQRIFTKEPDKAIIHEIRDRIYDFLEHYWKKKKLPPRECQNSSWCPYEKECYRIMRDAKALLTFRETLIRKGKLDAVKTAISKKGEGNSDHKGERMDKKPILSDAGKAKLRSRYHRRS